MILAAQGVESMDYKIIVAAFAIVVLAFKVVLDVLKWRRERDTGPQFPIQADPCKTCSRQVDDLHAWHAPEDVGSGRQSWKVPRDLVMQVDAIDRRTKDMERDLADLCAKAGVWNTPTSPGG
jgi:hypothetical protein